MTGSSKVKVIGYAQRVFYNDNIEYRNFTPDLAGLQLTTSGGTALFTMGNFAVTTNYEPKIDKTFITNNFSNFVSLTDLNTSVENSLALLLNNAAVFLNLDKTNLTNYALFGSLNEFVRVSLEDIILGWPAALYANPNFAIAPLFNMASGYTVENYTYDSLKDEATFKVNVNTLINKYQINYLTNGNLTGSFNSENELRDLNVNYLSYSVRYNDTDFDIIGFTGATATINDYLYFTTNGNVFSATTNNDYLTYYIKPNADEENMFFNALPTFEAYLLNRLSDPKYTASFKYSVKSDGGSILYITESVTWPTSDGYNIDFDSVDYIDYATKLSGISTNYDATTSGLMTRFLVSDSVTDFDTTQTHVDPQDQDTSDQKMLKTLNIYGRQYDERNNYIKGISFAHAVTYDQSNNTPNVYLKDLAKNLGWDLISSVLELDLLNNYIKPNTSTFSGHSIGLTPEEADSELWRRLILNTPWLWKSKGTRKAIEFLFKFIGTPLGLISFNEYVYVAQNIIDVDTFEQALTLNNVSTDLTLYPVSSDGFPSPLLNTPDLYFQSSGLWYRETGGSNSSIDVTKGNNPHVGPYDGGYKYINQFKTLIPNFSAVTISSETSTTSSVNLFNNYNSGTMTDYHGDTYVDVTNDDGVDFSNCMIVTSAIIEDPMHRQDETNCGCITPSELKSLSVCVDKNISSTECQDEIANVTLNQIYGYYEFELNQFNLDGSIYTINGNPVYYTTPFINKQCCNFNGSVPYFYNQLDTNGDLYNSGYICCKTTNTCGCLVTCGWSLDTQKFVINPQDNKKYLVFRTETSAKTSTSLDGCNCLAGYTIVTQIIDPITGLQGYGCQLTPQGITDLGLLNSVIVTTYMQRATGLIDCATTACIVGLTTSVTSSVSGLANGSISITPSSGVGPYSYLWTDGVTAQTATAISASTYTLNNLTNGTYTITVSDTESCSGTTIVNVPLSNCSLQLSSTIIGSTGTDGAITLLIGGAIGSYTLSWSSVAPNNVRTPLSQTSLTITGLTSGRYEAIVTDQACSKALIVTVPSLDCSQLTLTMSSTDTSASVIVGGASNVTYLWSNGGTSASISGVPIGTYSVTVTDTDTGCIKQGTVDVAYTVNLFWIAQPSADPTTILQPFAVIRYSKDGEDEIEFNSTINRSSTRYFTLILNIRVMETFSMALLDNPTSISGFRYIRFGTSSTENFNFFDTPYCGLSSPYDVNITSNQDIYINIPVESSSVPQQDRFIGC